MSRRYLLRPLPDPGECDLPPQLGRHLAVVRTRPGDLIQLFDGDGHEAPATVLRAERHRIRVAVGAAADVSREARVRVELACALPKGTRAEWLFEHATEVGVARFWPIVFARSERAARESRVARWERIVAAAAEQCDRSLLPRVEHERPLDALLAAALPAERYVAQPAAALPLGPADGPTCLLLVGPEGGLTDAEQGAVAAAGFAPRGLGPLTLRTETAALVGAVRLIGP